MVCSSCQNFRRRQTTKGYEMTQPVQEPTQGRVDAAQGFVSRQLLRRPAPAGSAASDYAWFDKTTNQTFGTGSVSVVAAYDTSGISAGSTAFDISNTAVGNIVFLETGIYMASGIIDWTTAPAPSYLALDIFTDYPAGADGIVHPFSNNVDSAVFEQYGPTGMGSLGPFSMSVSGMVIVTQLAALSTQNFVRLRAGQSSGVSATLDNASFAVTKIGDL